MLYFLLCFLIGSHRFYRVHRFHRVPSGTSQQKTPSGKYLINIAKDILAKEKDKWINKPKKEAIIFFQEYAVKALIQNIISDLKLINIQFDKFTFETDIQNKKLSISSPLAKGLIGKSPEDVVEINSPKGLKTYTVISVKYI